jgi:trans-2,3-dihydro-3-hydroxyanthranilate isomerase
VRTFRYVVADVFTDMPLTGNPLAVFTDARDLTPLDMQALAREMNLSETVFVLPAEAGGHARVRIFTPAAELPFAGHPILGTAFVLAAPMQLGVIVLETAAGLVPVELTRDDSGRIVFGRMQQPEFGWRPYERADELLAALGVSRSGLPVEVYDLGPTHVYVELDSPEAVAALQPDIGALAGHDAGVNCFARAGDRWKLRMFAPASGVVEDPATGSAAGPLAVHLARHGRTEWGAQIEIEQGVEIRRPSRLYARAVGDEERVERVEVGGSAVTVARGEFRLP